ncbi:MAG: ubiquinol-cytochrome c reductase iron-sulfur subunit [Planctomycetota bacterium]
MESRERPETVERAPRRSALTRIASWTMAGGLLAGYGAFAAIAGRYLYPARKARKGWMFVRELAAFGNGDSVVYRTPGGARVSIARVGTKGTADDFIALSSTCPHLGCQVHWEGPRNRFFCPCHNGAFDPKGRPIEGPPAEAGQSLPRYALKVENELLYIEVGLEELTMGEGHLEAPGGPSGPGHDPCLFESAAERRS